MDPLALGIVAMVVALALIFYGVPIGFALGVVGFVGNGIMLGWPQAIVQIQLVAWDAGTDFLLVAIPLFLLMGQLVFNTGIATDLFDTVQKWFGRLPGGLAVAATVASAGFGAVTGSSVAAVATMGTMVMPEMRRYKYDPGLATGSLAAAGTLAILIPPSIPMIFIGVWTETSIGKLFVAGIVPGLLLASLFALWIVGRCIVYPQLGPRGPRYSWSARFMSLLKLMPTAAIFGVVLGGIYGGVFTPTEASAIGSIGVVAVAAAMRRLTWRGLAGALHQAMILSAMIYMIFVGGILIGKFMVQTQVTTALIAYIGQSGLDRYVVIALFTVIYLILGAIMDTFGMIILTLPFVFPIVLALDFDRVWFGIYVTVMIELALITPPVGMNVFVMKRVAPEVPMMTIFRGAAPFGVITLLFVVLITLFPQIVLWLPSRM
ncbi:MAG: TRAP transporter large permease [Rhizobiales bacterium]|nr:TRAP transporter large permease [Hyphomicrobiales bacterium]